MKVSDGLIKEIRRQTEAAMRFTCNIERPTSAGTDDYGTPLPPSWSVLASIGCNYFATSRAEKQSSNMQYTLTLPELHVPFSTDVALTDRINSLVDSEGNSVGGTFNIVAIQEKRTVKILTLEQVN